MSSTTTATQDKRSIYEPDQKGLIFPREPDFTDINQTRRHRKERLAAACRAFALAKFDYGFAGHLSVRDPGEPDRYWTNPMAVPFSQVKVSNLVLADHDGRVIEGKYAINRAGFVLHAAVHKAHADIVAMCHAHTVYGTAFAALGKSLAPISQDAAAFYEDHAVVADEAGKVAVEQEAGKRLEKAFKGVRAVIHRNHGLLTVSRHSIEAAAFWFMALERCCMQQLLVEATGSSGLQVTAEDSRYSRQQVGSEYIGWLHFQTIWNQLLETQPDLLT